MTTSVRKKLRRTFRTLLIPQVDLAVCQHFLGPLKPRQCRRIVPWQLAALERMAARVDAGNRALVRIATGAAFHLGHAGKLLRPLERNDFCRSTLLRFATRLCGRGGF